MTNKERKSCPQTETNEVPYICLSNAIHMPLLNYNGVICSDEEPLSDARNRALRYGEGLIETMLWQQGRIRFQGLHERRAQESLACIGFPHADLEAWRKALLRTVSVNPATTAGILRTQFFRDDRMDLLQYMVELQPLPDTHGAWPESGMHTGVCRQVVKSQDHISHLKTTSRLNYILAARAAAQQGWDDALLLNPAGRIAESTISNVWIIRNSTMITPPLSEGCIAGIFRSYLLECRTVAGLAVREAPLGEPDLEDADELFLTNAIRGIQPVHRFGERIYTSDLTRAIFEDLSTRL